MKTISTRLTRTLIFAASIITLVACGGTSPGSSATQSSSAQSNSTLNAGYDQTVFNSTIVDLQASGTGVSAVQWQQISGPSVEWLTSQGLQASFIAPDVSTATEVVLQAQVNGATDQVSVTVQPCAANGELAFDECTAPGFGSWVAYESSDRGGQIFHRQGQGDYHVQWQRVDSGDPDHGMVMEITWNANDSAHLEDARGWFGLAMPGAAATAGADLSAYAQGALSFDMRLVYHEQPTSAAGFVTKMECVYPCSSAEMPIVNGNSSYAWQTHSYPISQLTATGLNLTKVNHAVVIQPDWFAQEHNVTVQIDNIRLSRSYDRPTPAEGCTGAGEVSYSLSRSANPTADEQDAYGLITAAMDRAVANYNCYTNLSRRLTVQYNPGVATADGSPNGNIRFGSRASMHYVTAMHEIAHTFGAGGGNGFRALVSDGVYRGPIATAKLREISGNPSDEIHSDGTHFWPHGLNYISEGGSQQDLIEHCWIVQAIVADTGG